MDSKDNKIFNHASDGPQNGRDAKGRFTKGNTPLNTVYNDDIPDKLLAYLNEHIHDARLCSFSAFCLDAGIHLPSYNNWINDKDNPRYARLQQIHAHFKDAQKSQIISGALSRTFDPSFAQFLLKAEHGMRDKQEISLDSKSEGKIDVKIKVIE